MPGPFDNWTDSKKANDKLNLALKMEEKGMSEEKVSQKIEEAVTAEAESNSEHTS